MTLLLHFNWCLRLTANKARLTTNNHLRLYKLNFPQRAHWNWRLKLGIHSSYIFAPPMYRHISYTNINAHQTSMQWLNFCLQTYLRGKKFSEGVALRKKTLLRCTACYHPFNHFSTWLQKKIWSVLPIKWNNKQQSCSAKSFRQLHNSTEVSWEISLQWSFHQLSPFTVFRLVSCFPFLQSSELASSFSSPQFWLPLLCLCSSVFVLSATKALKTIGLFSILLWALQKHDSACLNPLPANILNGFPQGQKSQKAFLLFLAGLRCVDFWLEMCAMPNQALKLRMPQ